jgi:hypothetical protein
MEKVFLVRKLLFWWQVSVLMWYAFFGNKEEKIWLINHSIILVIH